MWTKLILACALLALVVAPAHGGAPPATRPTSAAVVSLVGEVNDYTRDALKRQFKQARAAGATTVIVRIDTWGGLVTSAMDVTQFIRGQSDLHTVAYVDKAISAGAMIAVACDEIVMAPSAVIGDCAPIIYDTDGEMKPLPAAERAKRQSPIRSDFDASADRNGYDRGLLESMVVVERVVYYVENPATHARKFVDEKEYPKLSGQGWRDVPGVPSPVDAVDTLFTVHTDEAVKLGLAKGVSVSAETLATERGLTLVADLSPGAGEIVISFLNSPAVRGLAMSIFVTALFIALKVPGQGAAEAVTVVSLGVLLGVPLLTGYANWWEVLIILGGIALVAFEVFVFPGHGVSAIAGLVMIFGGLLMTFVGQDGGGPSVLPHTPGGWAGLRQGAVVIASGLCGGRRRGGAAPPVAAQAAVLQQAGVDDRERQRRASPPLGRRPPGERLARHRHRRRRRHRPPPRRVGRVPRHVHRRQPHRRRRQRNRLRRRRGEPRRPRGPGEPDRRQAGRLNLAGNVFARPWRAWQKVARRRPN